MQSIKSSIFLYLTPRQKSQLLGTLKSYFKKFPNKNSDELCYKFLEDEKYYIDINNPHFEFVSEYFDDDIFFSDLKKYFRFLSYEKTQMDLLEPYKTKQKQIAKQLKQKAYDYKMSKLKPTKKQLYYYNKITANHNVPKKDTTNATRLDLKNWIMEILNEFN